MIASSLLILDTEKAPLTIGSAGRVPALVVAPIGAIGTHVAPVGANGTHE
jgi:hypothetical protein